MWCVGVCMVVVLKQIMRSVGKLQQQSNTKIKYDQEIWLGMKKIESKVYFKPFIRWCRKLSSMWMSVSFWPFSPYRCFQLQVRSFGLRVCIRPPSIKNAIQEMSHRWNQGSRVTHPHLPNQVRPTPSKSHCNTFCLKKKAYKEVSTLCIFSYLYCTSLFKI